MATPMTNLVVKVTLPKGLKLKNGAVLAQPLSVEVIADLAPFYTSIPNVRLEGGAYLTKISDTTLAAEIYRSSKEADNLQQCNVKPNTPEGKRLHYALGRWVTDRAAYKILTGISGLVGYTGSHVLANFSVTKARGENGTGVSAKLNDLKTDMQNYEIVLRSCGQVLPGGRQKFAMAAKGLFDNEVAPGRTWMTTGMGANHISPEFGSSTGGRGKPVRYYASPMVSIRYLDARMVGGLAARRGFGQFAGLRE